MRIFRLLPEEAEILRRVQQDVGHFQSVCGCWCAVPCCGLLSRQQHQQTEHTDQGGWLRGCKLDTMDTVVDRTLNKLLSIQHNPDHPLHPLLDRQRSTFSNRLIQLRRERTSFLPSAILFNTSLWLSVTALHALTTCWVYYFSNCT